MLLDAQRVGPLSRIYTGRLDEEFARQLRNEMVAHLPTEPLFQYRHAIPGMPRDEAEALAQLDAMAGNAARTSNRERLSSQDVPAPVPDSGLITLRGKKSAARTTPDSLKVPE